MGTNMTREKSQRLYDKWERKDKLKKKITRLFKKWIVKRPDGQCQILFSLTELDNFVDEISDLKEV